MYTRIYFDFPISLNSEIELGKEASNYLVSVLRFKKGDRFILFNGRGGEYLAEIIAISKRNVLILILEFEANDNESPLRIELGQAISRGEKMDFTVQKATELGVFMITPLFTERCGVALKDDRLLRRLDHWQRVAISAAEQSRRSYVPKINSACDLEFWAKKDRDAKTISLVLDPYSKETLNEVTTRYTLCPERVILLVGPEGGLSDAEIGLAESCGIMRVSLGPRVLRTETAALSAISILQFRWGDLQ